MAAGLLAGAPTGSRKPRWPFGDIKAPYNKDMNQVTIWAPPRLGSWQRENGLCQATCNLFWPSRQSRKKLGFPPAPNRWTHFETAHLNYAQDGGALPLARMLAALTELELAVGHSGRSRDMVRVRRPPSAREFIGVLATGERPELRVAAGLASCATRPGPGQAGAPSRSMRQVLLPVDPPVPGDRSQPNGRWRDHAIVPGFGSRPLPLVLADVMIWRSRTAFAESELEKFRDVPTFTRGIPVPAADLHAFVRGELDEKALDLFLRACLALNWRGAGHEWQPSRPTIPVTTLGLLHPLARGLQPGGPAKDDTGSGGDEQALALNPDWAARLAAGQVGAVHDEAAARLRQAGWDAVPPRRRGPGATVRRSRLPSFLAACVPAQC